MQNVSDSSYMFPFNFHPSVFPPEEDSSVLYLKPSFPSIFPTKKCQKKRRTGCRPLHEALRDVLQKSERYSRPELLGYTAN